MTLTLLFSLNAQAVVIDSGHYPSAAAAQSACDSAFSAASTPKFSFCSSSFSGDPAATCTVSGAGRHKEYTQNSVNIYRFYYCTSGTPTCPSGQTLVGTQCVASCAISSGTRISFTGSGTMPGSICHSHCVFEQSGVSLQLTSSYLYGGKSTGATCSTDTPSIGFGNPGENCLTSSATGKTICASASQPNCGTVNGEEYCLDALPPGNCTVVGSHGYICDSGDPTGSGDDAPVPTGTPAPSPTDGWEEREYVDGVPVGDPTEVDYYPPSTDGNSAGPQESTLKDIQKGQCGGPGQPKCKIDEDGTPEGDPNAFDGAANGTGINGLLDGIGSAVSVDGPSLSFTSYLPAYSASCETISFTYKGAPFLFPSSAQCTKLNVVKTAVAWLLGLLTALAIYQVATRRPA